MDYRAAISRDPSGVPRVRGRDLDDLLPGLGFCHARDRGLQMLLTRLVGRGRVCEFLGGGDDVLATDLFFRRMNWAGGGGELEPEVRRRCQAYCDGVNAAFARRTPWELRLLGYRPDPWTVADCVLIVRMLGYVGLAQSQADMERLLVERIQAGTPRHLLEELFPGSLGELDEDLLRRVRLGPRGGGATPPAGDAAALRWTASNNWVVSGRKTPSGKPILASDPHLAVNRLPGIWYEAVFDAPARFAACATIPGLPGLLIGRTSDVAWGVTYAFIDAVDSWVEHCRGLRCRRGGPDGDEWVPLLARREVVRRKGAPPVTRIFYENEHGTLDGDPDPSPDAEGYYLATLYAGATAGGPTLAALQGVWAAPDAPTAMAVLGRVELACNWVVADTRGGIGYQMSGLAPVRRPGVAGLVPLPGWDPSNDWQGFWPPEDLPRCHNPESGVFVTANNDLNPFGRATPINLCMGPYRADRAEQVLRSAERLTTADMARLQYDLFSRQADAFMEVLRPLLPPTPPGRILAEWDRRYDADSEGAFLFERVYGELLAGVFGAEWFRYPPGPGGGDETPAWVDFFSYFDRVLLDPRSKWFATRARDDAFREAAVRGLTVRPRRWGDAQTVMLSHILLGGRLPRIAGFDRGPVALPGGRATISQGQVFRAMAQPSSFAPSLRMITDLSEPATLSNACWGPSDRRFSRWYVSELHNWVQGEYKRLGAQRAAPGA